MSVRNTLKNLVTVIECAENGDDVSSSIRKRKNAQETALIVDQSEFADTTIACHCDETEKYVNTSPREDESSPYQSAYSSIDDFINAEPNFSLKSDNLEVKCDYSRTPASKQKIQSVDGLSEYEESDDENDVQLPSVSSGSAATRTPSYQPGASMHGMRPKSFVIGRSFNHSRLNLLTFLNNIATPSIRTIHNTQRAVPKNRTTELNEKRQKKTSASIKTKSTQLSDGSKEEAETRLNTLSAAVKSDKRRNDEESQLSLAPTIGSSAHDTTNHFTLFTPKQASSSSVSATKPAGLSLSNTVVTAEALSITMNTGDARQTGEMLSSTRTVRNGKNCDKISTISDMTVASTLSVSSLSNGSPTNSIGRRKSRECIVCCTKQSFSHFTHLINCGHRSCCRSCMIKYLNVEIMENRTELSCPQCSALLHVNDVYALLFRLPRLLERYESFSLRRVLSADPDTRWCPAPDCTYAVIATACAACPQLSCGRPGCGTMFCYHCKNYWHANQTCDQARESAAFGGSLAKTLDAMAIAGRNEPSTSAKNSKANRQSFDAIKSCPRCGALIVKMNDGSCNHMTCALCGVEFCWLCLKQINELHYISPTGCTFWGKKPWTRKKKLLWQIGTLIGAPLGIALIAGLAVPGIICGVPIFVGRRTYQRFHFLSRTKRHLITAVSVTGSLLVSPVLAVMAVGVGVPIMLAYVYGVVPLSLCRNGGCGFGADAQELPYSNEEAENASLLNNERSQLLRALRESTSRTNAPPPVPSRKPKKPSFEITVSDRSSASSPSSTFFTTGLRNVDGQSATTKSLVSPSISDNEAIFLRKRINGEASISSVSTLQGQSVEVNAGYSHICTNSQLHVYPGTHQRQHSNELGIISFYDKTENASTKAIAGSHCYDVRSINTLWSSGGCAANICVGNNDDSASMKACGGSVLGARSLAESGTSSHLACLSRENDASPSELLLDACDFALKKFVLHSDEDAKNDEDQNIQQSSGTNGKNAPMKACGGSVFEACSLVESGTSVIMPFSSANVSGAAAVAEEFVHQKFESQRDEKGINLMNSSQSALPSDTSQCQCLQLMVFDELDNFHSLSDVSKHNVGKCAYCTELSDKNASVAMLPSTSQRSFCSGVISSPVASVEFPTSNISVAQSVTLKMVQKNESNKKNAAYKRPRQESSRMSLRKLLRRPIDLLIGHPSNNTESKKKSSTATISRKVTIEEIRDVSTNPNSKSVKIYTK